MWKNRSGGQVTQYTPYFAGALARNRQTVPAAEVVAVPPISPPSNGNKCSKKLVQTLSRTLLPQWLSRTSAADNYFSFTLLKIARHLSKLGRTSGNSCVSYHKQYINGIVFHVRKKRSKMIALNFPKLFSVTEI